MERVIMTKKGNDALREELKLLKSEERSKIIKAIAKAREFGDLKENAEYHSAKEKQSFIEGRINEIESKLSNAEIIDISKIPDGTKTVVFGATVQVSDLDNNTKIKFQIVGDDEAEIEQGLLSYKSPVAKSLIGKEKGDFATVTTPKGEKNYEIIKITYE